MEGLVQRKEQASDLHITSALGRNAIAFCCLLAGLEQLRHCTCLQTLDISYIPVKGSFLSTLTSLRSLAAKRCGRPDPYSYRGCEVLFRDSDNAMAGLTNLTALDIGRNDIAAGTPHLHSQCRHKAPFGFVIQHTYLMADEFD